MNTYKSIDLFAGIGGIRLGFEMTKRVKNIYGSEIDTYAAQTYEANYGDNPLSDITKVDPCDIPNFDILLAGFPCQAFSIAGRKGGFEDTRGTLFFNVANILKHKRPKAFLLENVKGLTMHGGGQTLTTILGVLDDLDYNVKAQVLNSRNFGVPQNRERIYIAGFLKSDSNFSFPENNKQVPLKGVLESSPVSPKYYLSQRYYDTLKKHKKRHAGKGNGYGYMLLDLENIANAIVVGGMGRERNLIVDTRVKKHPEYKTYPKKINVDCVRSLTPREWARLQGYPESFKFPVSDTQAYKQLGNSVTVPVINALAKNMIKQLDINKGQIKHTIRQKKSTSQYSFEGQQKENTQASRHSE